MFRFFNSTQLIRRLFFFLMPVLCVGLFMVFFFSINWRTIGADEQDGGLAQLRTTVERAQGKPSEDQLIYFERTYPKTRVAGLARLLRAYNRYMAADYAGSAPLFEESIIKEGTGLGDYALYYQGRAYRELGDYGRARVAFDHLADKYPNSPFCREAQIASAELSLELKDPKTAFKRLSRQVDEGNPAALLLTAKAYDQFSGSNDALNFYRKLYYEAPTSSESETAAKRMAELGIKLSETGKDAYKLMQTRADRLFEAKQFARAVDAYTTLMTQFAGSSSQSRNNLRLGISLYNVGRYKDALGYLQSVSTEDKEQYTDALYFIAQCYRRQKLMGQFTDTANQALSRRLSNMQGPELLSALVKYYESVSEEMAARYRTQLIKEYPESKEADEASFRAAWQLHNARQYEQASKALIEHLSRFPNTEWRGMSSFWAGRDSERAGQPARAAAIYEVIPRRYRYGYYGILAEKYLAQLKQQNRNLKPERPDEGSTLARALTNIKPAAPIPEAMTEKAEPFLGRAANLQLISLSDQALTELELARKDAPNSQRINLEIARIHRARGENVKAVMVLQRAHPDFTAYQGNEAPREVFEIFFPLIEWEQIKKEAARNNLDPYVVAGLIRQESVFDPRAHSRANALGLMQLLPSTGKLVARKQGSSLISADQLYNPQLNIKLGTAYLADMINKFGRIEYAAAAYNGGPGRVDRWLKTLPENLEDWVESIPITETRLYVQGVLRNSAHYRRLYPE
jgi:soluble lytic murein transglycosylase